MNHKKIRIIIRRRLFWVLLVVIVIMIVITSIYLVQPKSLKNINLQQVIAIPNDLANRENDRYCEEYLQVLPQRTEQALWYRIGLLLPSNQLREEVLINGCIRTIIAVFPNSDSGKTVFQSLNAANSDMETTTIVYSNANDNTVLLTTPFKFDYAIQGLAVKHEGENLLLISEKCNTVFTIFAFKRDEKPDLTTTFGMAIEYSEIVSYAKQIQDRIEDAICPVVVSHE